ncbi:hypothetical protein GCM10017581_091100 [Dactylosporangium matsuzakiense]|uniref:DUF305 domain-containing protein n=1 Tax=Dactylosporangium matsuzakiense TaxID=53360 RepID=A0A9W6KTI1_9ACTN|nr:hypothetical protein GCM10017581_091100 [Dactylosporangium matsuzakiense]
MRIGAFLRVRAFLRIPAVLSMGAVLAVLSGCGAGTQSAAPSPGGPAAVVASEFGGTDLAWVELMIPMDEQLLPVLDLVTAKAADPGLVAVAGELHGVYSAELPRLRAISDQAGLPTDSPHKGHKMPGLVDADRLAALRAGTGEAFEKQALDILREHLTQLANLAGSELTNGTSPTVKALAQQVAKTRGDANAKLPAATPTPNSPPPQRAADPPTNPARTAMTGDRRIRALWPPPNPSRSDAGTQRNAKAPSPAH